MVDGLRKDLSLITILSLLNYYHPLGLQAIVDSFEVKWFTTFCRIRGAGYRVFLPYPLGSKINNHRLWIWHKSKLPINWWLGQDEPLNPYLNGLFVSIVRN